MQFDGTFLWTDDASAPPPPSTQDYHVRDRRRLPWHRILTTVLAFLVVRLGHG